MVWSMLKGNSSWVTEGDSGFSSFRFDTNTQSFRGEAGGVQFTVFLRAARLHSIAVMCPPPGWTQFPLKSYLIVNYLKQTFGGYFSNKFVPL